MNTQDILNPVLATLLLTAVVWVAMLVTRMRGFSDVKDPSEMDTRDKVQAKLTGAARQTSDNFDNLLEVPLLFYALAAVLALSGVVSGLYVVCAWIFFVFRCLHSLVHCTYNNVMHRFLCYLVATIAFLVMLVAASIQLLL